MDALLCESDSVRHFVTKCVIADPAGAVAAQCGDDFMGGVLFHAGAHTITLGDPHILAVPLPKLWEM